MTAQLPANAAPVMHHRVDVAPGRNISVRVWGPRPSVFFIHGFGDGGFVWDGFVPQIARWMSCAVLDLAGHGESSWSTSGTYGAEAHADDVSKVLRWFGARAPILVGHSLGAEVATRVAARPGVNPEAVVLLDGGPDLQPRGIEQMCRQFAAQSWHYPSIRDYVDALAVRQPIAMRSTLEQYANGALRPCSTGGFVLRCDPHLAQFAPQSDSRDLWHPLLALPCHTTIIRAAFSAVLSYATARLIHERIPRSRLISIPAAGHALMLDNPSGVAAALATSLSTPLSLSHLR